MGEPKPLASLSSSLLARKGQAKPAMRPQGFASFGFSAGNAVAQEDLGWNDMGHDFPAATPEYSAEIVSIAPVAPVVSIEPPVVLRQQEELERELAPIKAAAVRAAPGSKGKAAFTLRLDADRHLRLRLACAVAHSSAQQFVIKALDAFLDTQPAVAQVAKTASAKISKTA
ncbi:MAG: hypothetical protein ABI898_11635 [Sphingomonadales bacterium]